ncbi:MAG: sigma-70 family RNA polymerase sigma factor [Calditrichaeota bacterium]|nr:MAG: sigma-70 family RNA polymerase sigma factor [Calditrichota bacterium]
MTTDRELVQQILSGDVEAFRSLIERYQRLVSHIVFRMIPRETDREEVCQEVFVKVYRNLPTFHFRSRLATWIGRIAYNTAVNYRKKKKLPLYEDMGDRGEASEGEGLSRNSGVEAAATDMPAPDESLIRRQSQEFLHREVDRLPPVYRSILTLYHLDGLSYGEIGEILDLPEGTVKSYLFRARKMLKEKLLTRYPAEEWNG